MPEACTRRENRRRSAGVVSRSRRLTYTIVATALQQKSNSKYQKGCSRQRRLPSFCFLLFAFSFRLNTESFLPVLWTLPSAEEVQMQMINHLPALPPGIEAKLVPAEALLGRDVLGGIDELCDDVARVGLEVGDGLNVALRNDEEMHRGLGVDILDDLHIRVLGDGFRRGFAVRNFAEDAVHTHQRITNFVRIYEYVNS